MNSSIEKPLFVHCHIFYTELWEELARCIHNIDPHPFDLVVTLVESHPTLEAAITEAFPKARIEIVPNRGYDVGPFIHVLSGIDLDHYSYVIKLHTKRDVPFQKKPFRDAVGSLWRDWLLKPFASHEAFERTLGYLNRHPKIGMAADRHTIVRIEKDNFDPNAIERLHKLIENLNWKSCKFRYVAGTMFIARAEIFKTLHEIPALSVATFATIQEAHRTDESHVFERLFGYLVTKHHLSIVDPLVGRLRTYIYIYIYIYSGRNPQDFLAKQNHEHRLSHLQIHEDPDMAPQATTPPLFKLLHFPVHGDHDGNLIALENNREIPFDVKRVYYIWGTRPDVVRGKHAHHRLKQLIICLSGSCDFHLDNGREQADIHLDSPTMGLYLEHQTWREFSHFSPDCIVMVLASEHYDERDYIRDYPTFLKEVHS